MTPKEIQNKLNEAVMNIQSLQAELDALKSNLSEIPNSCDHYILQPGEVVEVSEYKDQWHRRIFIKVNLNNTFECVTQDSERYNEKYYREGDLKYLTTEWKFCRRLSGEIIEFGCDKPKDYAHLLPEGYEFCTEEEALDWVKVELYETQKKQASVGFRWEPNTMEIDSNYKPYYRPIRPTQYHVAVHEAVTAEPNPYIVDLSNAPEWAELHAFDSDGKGYWYGVRVGLSGMYADSKLSGFTLPTGLDWTKSKTTRP